MDALELLRTRASNNKLIEPAPDADTLDAILTDALRAPDHALLRPWRVLVLRGESRAALGDVFADALVARQPGVDSEKVDRVRRKPLRAPLILVVAARPVEHPKAPPIEQVLSAGALTQNIMFGLAARGFAGIWRTGPMAYDPAVKRSLGLDPDDHIVAFVYAGTAGQPPPPIARPTTTDHVSVWPS